MKIFVTDAVSCTEKSLTRRFKVDVDVEKKSMAAIIIRIRVMIRMIRFFFMYFQVK